MLDGAARNRAFDRAVESLENIEQSLEQRLRRLYFTPLLIFGPGYQPVYGL